VQKIAQISILVVALLSISASMRAQYQDQDSRGESKTSAHAPSPGLRVDINTASVAELLKVPGMTRVWAERIARYRPYRTKLDLEDHGIVTEAVYERIKDYVIARHEKPQVE
jgi:DNA uptake protein ComE-like DNA-binding protein